MSDSDPPTTPTPITFGRSFIRPDIELVIWDVVYHVHSFTLRGSSKFFDASLSERWAHEEVHERPDSIKYVYAISNSYDDKDPAALHTLERIPRNKQCAKIPRPDTDEARKLSLAYRSLLRILHHADIGHVSLLELRDIVLLADYYLALPAVAGAVESVIIKFMSSSFLPGSSETPAMILWISSKIRSKDLYNDAFVHIVGNMSDGSYRARVLRYLESISIDVEMFLNEDIRILSLKFGIERKVAWLSRQQCKASSYTITIMEEAYRKVPNWQGGKHMDPSSKKVFYATFRDSRINSEVSRDVKQLLQDRRRLKLWMGNTECLTCADMGSTYPWEENDDDW